MVANLDKINALLGIKVPEAEAVDILKRLNFGVEKNGSELNITVPRYREDIDGYPDMCQ